MSGILALVSVDGRPVPEALARAQLEAIADRGEHAPRLWLGEGIALGHVNLPRTPEAEHEELPGRGANRRHWLTWDGRLDNREMLTQGLGLESTLSRALTDADFVLAAYARWGEACVERLLGDWVIVIWDNHTRRLFCAKDPLGWRPLFYTEVSGILAVGSEPQQLFAGGLRRPEANQEYVLRALAGAMQEPGETCYAGIRELQGGQSLSVEGGAVTVRTFWSRPPITERFYRRPEEYVDEFIDVSRRVTAAHLRSNRPIGVFLSGGLDSSYVAATAAQQGAEIEAITAYAPGMKWLDERRYARMVVKHLGIAHHEIDISDCWALSSRWLDDEAFDEPVHPPQGPHMIGLAAAARDAGVGVVLTGEGGDDWMDGRENYLADAILRGRLRTAWRLAQLQKSRRSNLGVLLRDCFKAVAPFGLQDTVARLRHRKQSPRLAPLVELERHWVSPARYARTLLWQRRRALSVEWRMRLQIQSPVVAWEDRHALKPAGIELRSPLNDRRIVELMSSTPDWMKRFNGRPKDILREAGYRVLPRAIFDREDKGIFNELLLLGLCSREQPRVVRAINTAVSFPGVRRQPANIAVSRLGETALTSWRPAWGLITTGLWLHYLGVLRSRFTDPPVSPPVAAGGILVERR